MGVLITSIIAITIIICIVFKNVYIKKCENSYKMTEQFNKFYNMYFMLEKWLEGQYSDRCIGDYIISKGWKNVAIYGCGDVGKLLYKELVLHNVNVVCGIDKNENIIYPIRVFNPNTFNEKIDAVIVTSIAFYAEIEELMRKKTNAEIVSLEEIVYENVY